jgi:hypothetical protein
MRIASILALASFAITLTVSAGCFYVAEEGEGGSGSGSGGHSDDPGPGSGHDPDPHPEPAACAVAPTYGDLGIYDDGAAVTGDADGDPYILVDLPVEESPHLLSVELWDGYGVLSDGWGPGSYEIAGDETDYNTCGTCVVVFEDYDFEADDYARLLVAYEGTVVIESLEATPDTGWVTGWIEGVSLAEVDPYGGAEACVTHIGHVAFDLPIESHEY